MLNELFVSYRAPPMKQVFWICLFGIVVALIGAIFISPTGPGSSRVVFQFLTVYSLVLIVFGPRFTKAVAVVMLLACLLMVKSATDKKERFIRGIRSKHSVDMVIPSENRDDPRVDK